MIKNPESSEPNTYSQLLEGLKLPGVKLQVEEALSNWQQMTAQRSGAQTPEKTSASRTR